MLSQLANAATRTRPGMVRRFLCLYRDTLQTGQAADVDFGISLRRLPEEAGMSDRARSAGLLPSNILQFPKVGHE